jgi:hypothetical protein
LVPKSRNVSNHSQATSRVSHRHAERAHHLEGRAAMRLLSAAVLCVSALAASAADEFKLEPGFVLLFDGKSLDGWQTKAAKPAKLDGKTDAFDKRFVVKDGELVIDPKVKGDRYIETVRQFAGDFSVKFDFKPGDGCNNDILLLGTKFDINSGKGGKGGVKGVKLDEWNTFAVNVKGGSAEFLINGEKAATQKTKAEKGPLTLRAEFGPMTVKNVRATESK